jgi:hypothetical protein
MSETVLITGASSGIGLELARLFAADGAGLVLVARRQDQLETIAEELRRAHGVEVRMLPKDLAQPTAPDDIHQAMRRIDLPIDVLVNNAGFGAAGRFAELDDRRQGDMLQVNIHALARLSRLFLPQMLERRGGGILNVGSTAAFQPGPNMAVYYATKAFVLSLSEALHHETRNRGVTVTCLCPGPTVTEFAAAAGIESSPLFKMWAMDAAAVARAGYRGFRRGTAVVVPGVLNWIGSFAVRLLPRPAVRSVTAKLHG